MIDSILDRYFKRPIFWDYLISSLIVCMIIILVNKGVFKNLIDNKEFVSAISSDLATVGFTSAGLILTLLTILITFKANTNLKDTNDIKSKSTFQLFFLTEYYFETVRHFKNCIKSLLFVSVLIYVFKLGFYSNGHEVLYYYNIGCLIVIVLTLWRGILILSNILKMQRKSQ